MVPGFPEERPDGLSGPGMDRPGGDFGQGDKDEAAAGHPGVGKDEARAAKNGPTGQQNVDIDFPRTVPGPPAAAQFGLHFLDEGQHLGRRSTGLDGHGGVDKPGLSDGADGRGPV